MFYIRKEQQDFLESYSFTIRLVRRGPCRHKRAFILGQPFCIFGEIRYEEESSNANDDRCDAFKDKDPAPSSQAADILHVGDCAGEEAAEGAGYEDGAPVDCEALLGFFAFVPKRDEVEACGVVSVDIVRDVGVTACILPGKIPASARPRKKRVARRPL